MIKGIILGFPVEWVVFCLYLQKISLPKFINRPLFFSPTITIGPSQATTTRLSSAIAQPLSLLDCHSTTIVRSSLAIARPLSIDHRRPPPLYCCWTATDHHRCWIATQPSSSSRPTTTNRSLLAFARSFFLDYYQQIVVDHYHHIFVRQSSTVVVKLPPNYHYHVIKSLLACYCLSTIIKLPQTNTTKLSSGHYHKSTIKINIITSIKVVGKP